VDGEDGEHEHDEVGEGGEQGDDDGGHGALAEGAVDVADPGPAHVRVAALPEDAELGGRPHGGEEQRQRQQVPHHHGHHRAAPPARRQRRRREHAHHRVRHHEVPAPAPYAAALLIGCRRHRQSRGDEIESGRGTVKHTLPRW